MLFLERLHTKSHLSFNNINGEMFTLAAAAMSNLKQKSAAEKTTGRRGE
jgi:hypothetical protein